MGDDIQMGERNHAGAQTNLFVKVDTNFTGVWPGDVLFNVDASIPPPEGLPPLKRIDGIHAVSSPFSGGRGVVGIGAAPSGGTDYSVGVVGAGPVGVVGQIDQSDILPALPPGFNNAGVLGSASGNTQAAGVIGVAGPGSGRGGVFTTGDPPAAQVQLAPVLVQTADAPNVPLPSAGPVPPRLPRLGVTGDVLAVNAEFGQNVFAARLWFCVQSGTDSQPAIWAEIAFSRTIEGAGP